MRKAIGLAGLVATLSLAVGCASSQPHRTLLDYFGQVYSIPSTPDEEDYWQTPKETLQLNKGDCEDKAFLLQSLLLDEGIKTKVIFGYLFPDKLDEMHAWLEFEDERGKWILDPANGVIISRKAAEKNYQPYTSEGALKKYVEYLDRRTKELREDLGE